MGVVSGVDRSPALRLLWVLSALGPVSSSWLVSLDTCTSDSAPSVLLSVTGLDSSATPKPRPPARCQKTCPPSSSAHLSSAFLPPPQPSSPQLSSPPLGALSWPASLGLTSRIEPPAKPFALPPAGMVGQGPLTSRCSTCCGLDGPCGTAGSRLCRRFSSLRGSGHVSRSGPNLHSSTCEPPVIDLLKNMHRIKTWALFSPCHIFATFARAVPLLQPRSSIALVSAASTASLSFFCSTDSNSCPCF